MPQRPAHLCLILNGNALVPQSEQAVALRAAVQRERETGKRLDVRVTWESGDATRMLHEAVDDGVDTVVIGGGDGSLNEVASALLTHAQASQTDALPTLGVVPMGTANDFARAAGLPQDVDEALRLACSTPAMAVGVLRVQGDDACRWCINLATGGFGTDVTVQTDPGLKKALGGLAYVITGLGRLGEAEPVTASLRGEGFEWQGPFIALGIGNGRQAGGGQLLCPQACIDDGLLDVTIVPQREDGSGLLSALGAALAEGRAAALEKLGVQVRLPWLEVSADTPLTLNLDGEPMQARAFRIDCLPSRLRMHLPPDSPLLSAQAPSR